MGDSCKVCDGLGAVFDAAAYQAANPGRRVAGYRPEIRAGYGKPCPACRSEAYRPVVGVSEATARRIAASAGWSIARTEDSGCGCDCGCCSYREVKP